MSKPSGQCHHAHLVAMITVVHHVPLQNKLLCFLLVMSSPSTCHSRHWLGTDIVSYIRTKAPPLFDAVSTIQQVTRYIFSDFRSAGIYYCISAEQSPSSKIDISTWAFLSAIEISISLYRIRPFLFRLSEQQQPTPFFKKSVLHKYLILQQT